MEIYFLLGHTVLICRDRRCVLPKNRCCSLRLIFERGWVTNALVLVKIDAENKGSWVCWCAHMSDHHIYLFEAAERCRALLAEVYLNASVWCSPKKLLLQLLHSTSHDSAQSDREWSCTAAAHILCLNSCNWWGPNMNRPAVGSLLLNANILGI